jgi:hypothetical protein
VPPKNLGDLRLWIKATKRYRAVEGRTRDVALVVVGERNDPHGFLVL